jgi:hypothetical protein
MPKPSSGPLAMSDYEELRGLLKDLNRFLGDCDRAANAKVDVAGHKAVCQQLYHDLDAIKREYFPDKP